MFYIKNLLVLCFATLCTVSMAINHWVLRDDGRITPKLDSPFYMRESDNFLEFLSQIKINDLIEIEYLKLLEQRQQIVQHMHLSVQFGEELVEMAKCAMNNYLEEKKQTYLHFEVDQLFQDFEYYTSSYLNNEEPHCVADAVISELAQKCDKYCFRQLESIDPFVIKALRIDAETLNVTTSSSSSSSHNFDKRDLQQLAVQMLQKQPHYWRSYTVSSYYWRAEGQAQPALECAILGVQLAPTEYRDTALLSLGTILMRAVRLNDAFAVLSAAVKMKPEAGENNMMFATTLALLHNFNLSLEFFDLAAYHNPALLSRMQRMRKFVNCLGDLYANSVKMYESVEVMKSEVLKFKRQKYDITKQHEKIIQRQTPFNARISELKHTYEDLEKRGQYCSSRTISDSKEPKLFCDFYSDMQMRLQSNDAYIESLETELAKTTSSVANRITLHYNRDADVENFKASDTFAELLKNPYVLEEFSKRNSKKM